VQGVKKRPVRGSSKRRQVAQHSNKENKKWSRTRVIHAFRSNHLARSEPPKEKRGLQAPKLPRRSKRRRVDKTREQRAMPRTNRYAGMRAKINGWNAKDPTRHTAQSGKWFFERSRTGVVGQGRRVRRLNLRACVRTVCVGSPHCSPTPVSGNLFRLLLLFGVLRFFFGGLLMWLI
jgi:hypothetical protein